MPTIVGPKGQVVIEKEIRERLGITPGAIAIQTLVGDKVEIRFIAPEHNESVFGVLAPYVRPDVPMENWAEIKRLAWEAAAREQEVATRRSLTAAVVSRRARKREAPPRKKQKR